MKASVSTRAIILTLLVAAVACGATPPPYAPLPIVDVAPQVVDDLEETRRYLNAFPLDDYQRYDVPDVGSFFIDDPADMIKQVIVAGDKWERHSFDLLAEHIVPGSVVIEVGAHIGTHTVRMGQLAGPWGRVYAFEPQRKIYRELHHNLALNGVTNVVALRMAIGSGETRIIEMNPASPGNEGGTGVGSGGDAAELRSLDSFGFERLSLLKIDVETYENEVLDGALDTIHRNRPVMLIEIMGGHDPETASPDVLERIAVTREKIEALGYSVTQVFKHDYIAVPVD
ncbi:MAG: FkbM family methyltransferase [Acidobacteriota bacterium]|nr:FkbM family methyltransferase [Acidobacteriota bacterium]